jgi:alpha-ketoglutarate-dependent taurine dioxygenase
MASTQSLTRNRERMLTRTINDPRAWRAASVDECRSWYFPLSQRCLAALDETLMQLRDKRWSTTDLCVSETPCAGCKEDLQPVLAALEMGRGFVIMEGLADRGYTDAEQQAAYWLVGQLLGSPCPQNVQGTLLYTVRDTGQSVRYGARFSVTNAETGFHTDNSFGEATIDYVGLLCLRTANSGGANQLVSGYSLHNELLARCPEVLEALYQPFHIDRRGGLRPGDTPTIQFPILHWDGQELVCRYLRYWIEAGHEKVAQPLTAAQKRALELLDQVTRDRELQVEFTLRPGDMFFINNRWLLHNRSAFTDHAEPERRRHYVRLWLQSRTHPTSYLLDRPCSAVEAFPQR